MPLTALTIRYFAFMVSAYRLNKKSTGSKHDTTNTFQLMAKRTGFLTKHQPMRKGNKLYSIFLNTCPRCQTGSFFTVNNAYNLKQFDQMNERCPCCGERFLKEPGYYTGALYVSYAYYVALIVSCFIVFEVLLDLDLTYFLLILVALIIGLTPPVFRLARLTWINFFVSFDPHRPTSCP